MKSNNSSLTASLYMLALTIFGCLPASSQTNVPGTAVSLNGTTNAWLNVPNGTWFSGNFTVEAWVNVKSINSWSRLIDFSDGPNTNNVYLALSDSTTGDPAMGVFTNNDSSPFFSANTQLPTNQWVHLAATGNGTNGTIYLNGVPVGTGMLNIAPNIVRTNNYIGRSVYSADSYANAIFDELSIWNVARTRVQIQTGMNHPLVSNEPGLAGYWRFDEGIGTNAFDSTGNGNTATLNSGVTWTNSTAPLTNAADYALSFNGAQVVTIPHQAAQDSYPFTVMCWFMEPTKSPGGGALVGNYVSSSFNGWQLAISGGLYAWYYRDSSDHVGNTSAGAVNDGLWHHAAFVVNSAGGVIYLDGVPKQTNAWAGTAGPCTTTEAAFLGIYQGDSLFTGDIDEVSIWNVALTQSQIQTYMHQPLQGTESGLINYYRMNEGIGTNIYDYTTNADTGTFSAPPPAWIISGAQVQKPQVTTLPATVNGTSATLNGTVNPEGQKTGSWFNWGLTTGYGNLTVTNTFAASYTISTNTATLTGLSSGTYHFQIVATNASGTNYGVDQSFTVVVPQFQLGNTNVVEGPASGEDSVVLAVSPTNASWSATANASWLHLTISSGIGSTNVIFSFDANSGATRAGTLTIAGQTLTVTQAGSTYVQVFTPITLVSNNPPNVVGVAVDNQGDVYFASSDSVEEWIPTNNTVSMVIPYSAGAFAAENMTVDSVGNLYIASFSPAQIDKWTATNRSLTAVVPGLKFPSGVALDSSGDVYFSDLNIPIIDEWVATNNSIINLVRTGSRGLAVDAANNVYWGSGLVSELNAQNQSVTTLINFDGNYTPDGLAVDGGGNLYMVLADFVPYYHIAKWSAATGLLTTLVPTPPGGPGLEYVAVDNARNIYFGSTEYALQSMPALQELPYAFVDPTAKSEPATAGSDSLPAVVPANINLNTPFAPTSDQSWLTIAGTANGVVSYSFTADNSPTPRTAHIQLLGDSITVNQAAGGTLQLGTTNLLEGPIGGTDSVIVVVSPATLSWTASANATWLHLSATSQSGDTNLLFTFDTNSGATRTGTITIGNQTLTVTQAPSNYVAASVVTLDTNGVQSPFGMAMDSTGNIYWAGSGEVQEWIRTNDTIVTLVSNGLQNPISVAVDSANNVYIADSVSNTVTKWTAADGNLTTLVASGLNTPYAVALDTMGNVYIADQQNNAIKEWLAASSNVVTLVSTGLNGPSGVAVDLAGNVYIADTDNSDLKEWSPATGNVTTLATSTNGIYYPFNLTVDDSGNVFVGQPGDGQVLEWSPDGAVNLAAYADSAGAAVDSAGNLYLVPNNGALGPSAIQELPRAFMVPTAKFEPFAGGNDSLPPVVPANILQSQGLYPTNDQPWVAITGVTNGVTSFSFAPNNTGVARSANIILLGNDVSINQNAVVLGTTNLLEGPVAGTDSITLAVSPPLIPWSASANVGWLHPPVGYPTVAVPTNVMFTFDANPGATRTGSLTMGTTPLNITQAGVTYVATPGTLTALVTNGLAAPAGVAVDSSGYVYIANTSVQSMDEWVMASNSLDPIVYGSNIRPTGAAFANGILYYSDTASNLVYAWVQGLGNTLYPDITSGLNGPHGVAVDSSGDLYIADSGNNAIEEFNTSGNLVTLVSGLNGPEGVALDAFGDVYIADTGNNAIKEWFPVNGNLVTIVSAGLNQPAGLAVDASGNIFIADTGDNAIKEWTAVNGTLITLVGTGINQPTGVALDSADDLYIADTGNNMVEELPRAFVDPTAVSEPWSAGSDTWSMILPATVNLLPPFAPTSDQPWLNVTDTRGGIVSFDLTANVGTLSPRTAHINVLGESVSVTQTNAPVLPPQLTGAQQLGNGEFQFTFTNTPGTTFTVLATTNLALPLTDWVNLGTVSNISPGIYQFTTSLTNSQEFYEVIWP